MEVPCPGNAVQVFTREDVRAALMFPASFVQGDDLTRADVCGLAIATLFWWPDPGVLRAELLDPSGQNFTRDRLLARRARVFDAVWLHARRVLFSSGFANGPAEPWGENMRPEEMVHDLLGSAYQAWEEEVYSVLKPASPSAARREALRAFIAVTVPPQDANQIRGTISWGVRDALKRLIDENPKRRYPHAIVAGDAKKLGQVPLSELYKLSIEAGTLTPKGTIGYMPRKTRDRIEQVFRKHARPPVVSLDATRPGKPHSLSSLVQDKGALEANLQAVLTEDARGVQEHLDLKAADASVKPAFRVMYAHLAAVARGETALLPCADLARLNPHPEDVSPEAWERALQRASKQIRADLSTRLNGRTG